MTTEQRIELKRGLRDVYIDRTEVSSIDGRAGTLSYRGYNIDDLVKNGTFEETAYLILHGTLPTASQLRAFDAELKANRGLPKQIVEVIRLTQSAHPMDVLRTAVSAAAAFDPEVKDNSIEATIRKGTRLTAMAPTIVAAHARIRQEREPLDPDAGLNHAGNFLWTLFGAKPDPADAALLDTDFILHAEHGINASAFGARVTASTEADLHAAVTTGMAVLKGPAHGGAAEEVMKMALEVGDEKNAPAYVKQRLAGGGRVMGFGHRVYRAVDPRAAHIKAGTKALGERKNQPKWFRILDAVSAEMAPYARRGVCENVDFWSGAMYYLLSIPEDLFISIFAMGRIPGWTAQVVEQFKNNILLRPRLLYVGPTNVEYVPIANRS